MKKAINITIGNLVFYIEDDAFTILDSYIESIKIYFATLPDSEDIVQDMESRIAEHFASQKGSKQDHIITKATVEHLISVMGNVSEFEDDNTADIEKKETIVTKKTPAEKRRRLLRNPDDKMLFGVCSGLGAYFNTDPIIFRVIFVLATILWGWGIILYLILWLITPEAQSTTDKMEMRGKQITVSSLKEEVRGIAEKHKGDSSVVSGFVRRFFNLIGNILTYIFKTFIPLLGRILAGVLVAAFGIALIATTFILTTLAFNYNAPYTDLPLYDIVGSGYYYTIIISIYIVIIVPLTLLFSLALSAIRKKFIIKKNTVLSMCGVWIIAVSMAGASIIHSIPLIDSALDNHPLYTQITKDFDFSDFSEITTNDHIQANIIVGETFSITASGSERAIELLNIQQDGDKLELSSGSRPAGCFICLLPIKDVTIDITLPQITSLTATDVSRITTEILEGETLSFTTKDVARITTEVTTTDSVTLASSDASRITISGQTNRLSVNTSDVSRIYAKELLAIDVVVVSKDASRSEVYATENLEATVHDVARIQYTGDPDTKESINDVGKITKAKD